MRFKNIEQTSRLIIEVLPMIFGNNQTTQSILFHH
jgi:hypothetical protein